MWWLALPLSLSLSSTNNPNTPYVLLSLLPKWHGVSTEFLSQFYLYCFYLCSFIVDQYDKIFYHSIYATNATFVLEVTKFLFFHGFFVSKPTPTKTKKSKGEPISLSFLIYFILCFICYILYFYPPFLQYFIAASLPKVLGMPLRSGSEGEGDSNTPLISGAVRTRVQQQFFKLLIHTTSTSTRVSSKSAKKKDQNGHHTAQAPVEHDASTLFAAIVHFHCQLATFTCVV